MTYLNTTRMEISDGFASIPIMLTTNLNNLISKKKIAPLSIIKISKHVHCKVLGICELASSKSLALEPKVGVILSQPDDITLHGVHHQINTFADEDMHVKAASMENMSNGQKK
ncbi:hypothetical protein DACRYDRAFT_16624 [Dacryopinax primogenitus]|uniref:Replication factor-A protein 1 N-terminal domain-containing protein n=1 Tax=Dacryopinax primogenitus (strain DJM 731) TaxID=1858805 RepID=M5FSY9_DACPD|nr:uncharacterized protein DACRYDRAFT_16624 [Dacryopinax primogenitus]EJU00646.1 hypothetical protein DACRYDRAFT_16624 [Dacryopinax primogenitus]